MVFADDEYQLFSVVANIPLRQLVKVESFQHDLVFHFRRSDSISSSQSDPLTNPGTHVDEKEKMQDSLMKSLSTVGLEVEESSEGIEDQFCLTCANPAEATNAKFVLSACIISGKGLMNGFNETR